MMVLGGRGDLRVAAVEPEERHRRPADALARHWRRGSSCDRAPRRVELLDQERGDHSPAEEHLEAAKDCG